MFNAIKYTEELEKAGFTDEQAKASLKILIEVMNENFATREDMSNLRQEMSSIRQEISSIRQDIVLLNDDIKEEISSVRIGLSKDIATLDRETGLKMEALKSDLTIRLGSIVVVAIGVFATLTKLLSS